MQTSQEINRLSHHHNPAGGRIASDALRTARSFIDAFTGLENGADRYSLLLLVKRVGKHAGFTPRMIQLLDYYMAFTRECDWEEGSRPIIYQSLSRTALDLGVSERQVQKLEASLFSAGAITYNDSGNHKRYGKRCSDTGRIVYAYGVDLTPLAYLREELEGKLESKQQHDDAWLSTKRAISEQRREFRSLIAECLERDPHAKVRPFLAKYEQTAVQVRTHIKLGSLKSLLEAHLQLVSDLNDFMGVNASESACGAETAKRCEQTPECSPSSEQMFAHYKYTTLSNNHICSPRGAGLQKSVAETQAPGEAKPSEPARTAMEHVSIAMALGAASERFAGHLPVDPDWGDAVEAAYRLRTTLGISQSSWAEACGVLGRNGAAVCLLIADRAALRAIDPVRSPPAYFRGMVRRAEAGELRLCRSLFGLLEKARRARSCAA